MFGPGRAAKAARVGSVRELSEADLKGLKRGRTPAIQKFRDSHHLMASYFACGLGTNQVAELTGYSVSRVSLIRSSPAFQDLVEQKRGPHEAGIRDQIQAYNQMILSNGMKAERKVADRLDKDDDVEELSIRELMSISRDAADRVGLSKRSIQTNVSVDFASLLDRAIARTRATLPRSADLKLISNEDASQARVAGRGILRRRI